MRYFDSISDFFKSPKWGMNLLLSAVCILVPIVGPLVLHGWHITGLWARNERDPARFPDFDFNQFGKYLERGLWPFVVSFVVTMVVLTMILPVLIVLGGGFFLLVGGDLNHEPSGVMVVLIVLAFIAGYFLVFFTAIVLQVPFVLGATISQDFGAAFNFAFVKPFLRLVWVDLLLAVLFLMMTGLVLGLAGLVACYFGVFFTMPLSFFASHHLQRQLYDLYLSRGGMALPLSPKLADVPPALPNA
jgi:hypothetical protein